MVQEEVNRQLQDTKVVSIKKRKWNKVQTAAAAALCLLATSTVAYAGNRLYHMYVEKQGNYRVETGIQADGGTLRSPGYRFAMWQLIELYSGMV